MTPTQRSIVAGVDGSPGSRAAAEVAAWLAGALDDRLLLVHAVDDPSPFPYGDARVRELERGRALREGARTLEQAAAGLDAGTEIVLGDPATCLDAVAYEQDAELLVVGSRGRSGLTAALVGSVSRQLAGTAGCPVVVVSPEAGERGIADGTIVCGFDGSDESRRALRVARRLGERADLDVAPVFVDPVRGRQDAFPGPVQAEVGDPVQRLRERAARDDVRLLVVGSRGRGPVRSALLGSVSAALAASAPCPVLVVPPSAVVIGDPEPAVYEGATVR